MSLTEFKRRISAQVGLPPKRRTRKYALRMIKRLAILVSQRLHKLVSKQEECFANRTMKVVLGTGRESLNYKDSIFSLNLKHDQDVFTLFWFQLGRERFIKKIIDLIKGLREKNFIVTKYVRLEALDFCPVLPLPKVTLELDQAEVERAIPLVRDKLATTFPYDIKTYMLFPVEPLIEAIYTRPIEEPDVEVVKEIKSRLETSAHAQSTSRRRKERRKTLQQQCLQRLLTRPKVNFGAIKLVDGTWRQTKIDEFFKPVRSMSQPMQLAESN